MPTDSGIDVNAGWDLFKHSLSVFRKHPVFIVPIFMVWCVYAPAVIYSKYLIPWHSFGTGAVLGMVFLEIFWFSLIILAGCTVMLEMIRQMEFGQEISVIRATGKLFEKDILKIVPLAIVWATIWFVLTVIQALLSSGKNQKSDNTSELNLENTAKTLARYQNFSWTNLTFQALQKGVRMIVFLILPAIVWEGLNFTDAVKKGMVVLKTQIKGFVIGYGLTYATAVIVFLPSALVIEAGTPHKGTPPLFHYPPSVWIALIVYVGLAWSFCMYIEQMFMASLYNLQMNWLKAVAIAKMHGETVPSMHQVPIPELLGLPEIADGGNNDVVESGKRLYAQGDYSGAYQKFMKVLMRDSKNSEAQQYLKMTARRMSGEFPSAPTSPSPA